MIRKVLRAIVFGNLWIAIAATGFSISGAILLNGTFSFHPLFALIFGSTWATYTLMRLKAVIQREIFPEGRLLNWVRNHKRLNILFCLIGISISAVSAFFLDAITLLCLAVSGLLSLAYVSRVFFWKGQLRELREVSVLKTILVAGVWAIVSVLLVWLETNSNALFPWGIFTGFFLIILGLTIPFDIRDLHYDQEIGLKTIAMSFGKTSSKLVASFCLSIGVIFILFCTSSNSLGLMEWLLFFWLAISLTLLWLTNEKRPEFWYTGLLDGLIILFSLIVIGLH